MLAVVQDMARILKSLMSDIKLLALSLQKLLERAKEK